MPKKGKMLIKQLQSANSKAFLILDDYANKIVDEFVTNK